MGSLFRPTYSNIDPESGERRLRRSDKWYADYRDADGKRRRVPLSNDKSSAQAMLVEILRTVERQKAGLLDKVAGQLEESVENSIDDYQQHLESKGRSVAHISETIRHIRKLVNETGCAAMRDLQRAENSIEKFLSARRKAGKSNRTINAHLTAVRSFCRWLIQKNRLSADPTMHLEKLDEDVDRRRQRRPLTDEEATRLFKTTLSSKKTFRGLSGEDRAMLYMLAQRSGLRRRELLTLTPRSFDFTTNPPTVRVEARNSKHRKEDILPLPNEVANDLKAYLKGKDVAEPIWPGEWWQRSADMFRADLAVAEIEDTDPDGKVLDFHGQRMTFISGLARAGVSPTKAQRLARHSDVNLTLRAYTHLKAEDLASAVESLPSLRGKERKAKPSAAENVEASDPALDQIVQAWPKLSSRIREAITAIVQSAEAKQSD